MAKYSIGLDYGTNSVRAVVVSVADGATVGSGVYNYPHGDMGVVTDPATPTWRASIRLTTWPASSRP